MVDRTDRKLLALLIEDARRRFADLGAALHLSAPAVHERARRLREAGVIRRHTVELDAGKIGLPLLAYVSVVTRDASCPEICDRLARFAEVEECHSIAGEASLLLRVRTADPAGLEAFLNELRETAGVVRTETTIVLATYLARGTRVE